jgi:2-amino-4-hydroxy-6-hydroxymethyldihydropteridine diphosphokinase
MSEYSHLAFVALGANLPSDFGSPVETLEVAIGKLQSLSLKPVLRSSFWQSEPLDCPPDSPVYTNAVIGIEPEAQTNPEVLFNQLQKIENQFGRVRSGVVNEARVLDLDLIAFGQLCIDSIDLVLPHPRAHERLFVLLPLQQVAPEFRFPDRSESLDELIGRIKDQPLYKVS